MSLHRIGARLCAVPAAAAVVTVAAALPAAAHVTGTPSDASAGAFTVMTMSVPHGCDGSATTRIEVQIPESVLSVTPTRNPLYELDTTIEQLDEPVTDAHGNEVTERTGTVVYTAKTPLPEGQRDTFELSFQVPDAEGELLAFPTVQTCEQGETGWVEVPAEGQDAEELEHPAPAFEILPAGDEADHHATDASDEEGADDTDATQAAASSDESGTDVLGWLALAAGLLGLAAGVTALSRSRTSA